MENKKQEKIDLMDNTINSDSDTTNSKKIFNEGIYLFSLDENKIDKIKKDELFNMIMEYKDKYEFKEIIPISALKEKNIEELLKKCDLEDYVTYYFEAISYTWRLMKFIEENDGPIFDFCYIDVSRTPGSH